MMKSELRKARSRERVARIQALTADDPALAGRLNRILTHARNVRVTEYHLTNACNIRCKGCWFFEYGHDTATREVKDLATLDSFLVSETKARRVNAALVIGGEPTLFPDRLRLFVKHIRYVTVSSNGLRRLPWEGFEDVTVMLTLFGGGQLDDELRAIKPSGRQFTGLFETVLDNYRDDPRANFVYALTEDGIGHIEETVRRIRDNGNRLSFNFYSKYGSADPTAQEHQEALLAEALRVKALYPDTVLSHPYYIEAMITGRTHWGASFGYDVCPSISIDHPDHAERLENGNPVLPFFNTWAADLKTVKFCCTSGHCDGCRDSQAVNSWLMVSMDQFLDSREMLETWIGIAEGYWNQFVWTPFNPSAVTHAALKAERQGAQGEDGHGADTTASGRPALGGVMPPQTVRPTMHVPGTTH
ncbi:radical SAM protein [Tistrella sp. BH-R2-4]|jgi:MoaA/NifB/PqqE/SkfB family radical SAM enzyme|uniref:Radical SAM protein n=2 Tax=Geminicoccaceae TaxID=2066434 RepID=A0ABU9YSS3_9PROT